MRRLNRCLSLSILALAGAPFLAAQAPRVEFTPVLAADASHTPQKARLSKLPAGAIRPEGWLRTQLELMANGFTGHLPELSKYCKFEGNAWVDANGEGANGWEEVPYWLRGFTSLGYALQDQRIIAESRRWIDGVIKTQRPDGYFGPRSNLSMAGPGNTKMIDLWPNMIMLYALRTYYEATGDHRVIDLMTRYFEWQSRLPDDQLLPASWQKIRGGDDLDSLLWLYRRMDPLTAPLGGGGEGQRLVALAGRIRARTADWTGGVASWHGVNFAECFREPAQFGLDMSAPPGMARFGGPPPAALLQATVRNYDTAMRQYGQVPGGMFGADENARPGYSGPRQAAETCSMVEFMHSGEMLAALTGDPVWLDRAEDVAFNSLPASMTPDLKGLHYLTAPNQIQLDRANKAPTVQNSGDMFSYNPYQYRCCQHNSGFGWPYYAESLWMATPSGGLAAAFYAPSTVTAEVAGGEKVKVAEDTAYPFDGGVRLSLTSEKPVRFPLVLRVPGWSGAPSLTLNGRRLTVSASGLGWLTIDRQWRTGDRVAIHFPMKIAVRRWEANKNSVSIDRGPLTYSLKIGETWQTYPAGGWSAYEVFPAGPWNYGLILDETNPAASISVSKDANTIAGQPFSQTAAPIELRMYARKIPAWKQESNGMVGDLPQSPAASAEPAEEITLIPMGCARLRISSFPVASAPRR
jgi:hypothetical protein